jgi:ABC-2 type transport system permease protein
MLTALARAGPQDARRGPVERALDELAKVRAFLVRDYLIDRSYASGTLLELARSALPLLSFYYVSLLIPRRATPNLDPYGGDYFAFVAVGLIAAHYFVGVLLSFSHGLRRIQAAGCFEAILSTATRPSTVAVYSAFYGFIARTAHLLANVAIAAALGLRLPAADYLAAGVGLVLGALAFLGIGLLSAASVVLFKRGDPVEWLTNSVFMIIAGVYFPQSMYPDWMQRIAALVPLSQIIEVERRALLTGATLADVAPELGMLAGAGALLIPLGLFAFSRAVELGRRDGSLGDS